MARPFKAEWGANKVEEKDEQGNQVIGTFKRGKALFGFVPSLELLIINKIAKKDDFISV